MITSQCEKQLRESGYKVTQQRCDVLCELSRAKHPVSVNELIKGLGKKAPNIVTVYRVLESFVEQGLAQRLQLRSGEAMFEFAGFGDHHHIVCTKCDKIEELDDCIVGTAVRHALKQSKKFASITQHAFELYGLCKSCAR